MTTYHAGAWEEFVAMEIWARSGQIFRQADPSFLDPFAYVIEGRHALEAVGELGRPARCYKSLAILFAAAFFKGSGQ